jgi:hypothetical protein
MRLARYLGTAKAIKGRAVRSTLIVVILFVLIVVAPFFGAASFAAHTL